MALPNHPKAIFDKPRRWGHCWLRWITLSASLGFERRYCLMTLKKFRLVSHIPLPLINWCPSIWLSQAIQQRPLGRARIEAWWLRIGVSMSREETIFHFKRKNSVDTITAVIEAIELRYSTILACLCASFSVCTNVVACWLRLGKGAHNFSIFVIQAVLSYARCCLLRLSFFFEKLNLILPSQNYTIFTRSVIALGFD